MKHNQKLKLLLRAEIFIYAISVVYGFYHSWMMEDDQALGMCVVACLTPWIVPLIFHLAHFKRVVEIDICNIAFVYFASLIGSVFHGYSVFGFDKVVHFCSGLLLTTCSILLFMIIKKTAHIQNKEDYHLFLIFINAMNLAIAVCWEFYEYAMLIFFNNDCINHYTQGVHDSITDMLCAFVGGILITQLVMRSYRKKTPGFITSLCEKFYRLNIEKHS